ncbi:MAG: exodeoxyribonuclease V subunit alpha [Desulfuromonadales bacterium]
MIYELNAIDRHFSRFIAGMDGGTAHLETVTALVSNVVGSGSICLNLADIAGRRVSVDGIEVMLPEFDELCRELASVPAVGAPGEFTPLVLDRQGRLYLYRYWKYERDLAQVILLKATVPVSVDENLLGEGLERLFNGTGDGIDWQKVAAVAAVRGRFCVISGGPGTGKTSTVVKILALLLEQARGEKLRIALAAPTGKSAARLKSSICAMKDALNCAASVKDQIPLEVSTLHRLLGVRPGAARFRHSEENRLPFDVVIVDEASMVSLPLMAKLAVALEEGSRLILLGDRDQLSSVETGAVLGDICGGRQREYFSASFASMMERLTRSEFTVSNKSESTVPLTDAVVMLRKNFRFGVSSGIGAVGRAINEGNGIDALALFGEPAFADIAWRTVADGQNLKNELAPLVIAGYSPFLAASSPAEALAKFDDFRVLCAVRQGVTGVSGLNEMIEIILSEKGLIDSHDRWYAGRPLMITANDYGMKLFNGDIGIVLPDPQSGNLPRVFFPAPGGGIRSVSPLRLPPHETAFAMTVHKSQGSEFDRLLLLLPGRDSELLTRELIYTGITRGKSGVELWGGTDVFMSSVSRNIVRNSGLRETLWPGC